MITNQEAINIGNEILRKIKLEGDVIDISPKDYEDFIAMSLDALEKQVPKKPFEHWIEGMAVPLHECPVCHLLISRWVDGYFFKLPTCYCGQAIDWREEE